VDPSGGKYRLFTWAARSRETNWHLVAWSGDVRRALFIQSSSVPVPGLEQVVQLQLRTGAVSSFRLPANVNLIGYTRPDGLACSRRRAVSSLLPARSLFSATASPASWRRRS
jgi:hypothetical protein